MDIGRLRILECRVIRGRDINLAISSLIRGETYYLQISLQKLFHQHLKLAFGQSQKEYKEKRLIPRAGPYCSFMSNPKLTLLTETGSLKTGSVKDDFSGCLIKCSVAIYLLYWWWSKRVIQFHREGKCLGKL